MCKLILIIPQYLIEINSKFEAPPLGNLAYLFIYAQNVNLWPSKKQYANVALELCY